MNFLTSFLKTIQASIYSPKFYSQLKKSPFQSSFNYFLILAFFLSFIQVIFLAYPLITQTPKQLNFFANAIVGSYPKDLEINIQNGQVKINQPEPYFIHFSKEIPKPNLTDLENLVVIDTNLAFSKSV
ncbi:DUF1189 family protein [Candidatus Daviesbacteria bacterium]|nr:DUF1189 family protein [Candidatus Daviesbacteria bacterium]